MYQTHLQIVELTHKTRYKSQAKALRAMGIPFKVRPDGSIAVLTSAVEREMGAESKGSRREQEPDFGAIYAS